MNETINFLTHPSAQLTHMAKDWIWFPKFEFQFGLIVQWKNTLSGGYLGSRKSEFLNFIKGELHKNLHQVGPQSLHDQGMEVGPKSEFQFGLYLPRKDTFKWAQLDDMQNWIFNSQIRGG